MIIKNDDYPILYGNLPRSGIHQQLAVGSGKTHYVMAPCLNLPIQRRGEWRSKMTAQRVSWSLSAPLAKGSQQMLPRGPPQISSPCYGAISRSLAPK